MTPRLAAAARVARPTAVAVSGKQQPVVGARRKAAIRRRLLPRLFYSLSDNTPPVHVNEYSS